MRPLAAERVFCAAVRRRTNRSARTLGAERCVLRGALGRRSFGDENAFRRRMTGYSPKYSHHNGCGFLFGLTYNFAHSPPAKRCARRFGAERSVLRERLVQNAAFCASAWCRTRRSARGLSAQRGVLRYGLVQNSLFSALTWWRTQRSAPVLGAERGVLRHRLVQNAEFCVSACCRTRRSASSFGAELPLLGIR